MKYDVRERIRLGFKFPNKDLSSRMHTFGINAHPQGECEQGQNSCGSGSARSPDRNHRKE